MRHVHSIRAQNIQKSLPRKSNPKNLDDIQNPCSLVFKSQSIAFSDAQCTAAAIGVEISTDEIREIDKTSRKNRLQV